MPGKWVFHQLCCRGTRADVDTRHTRKLNNAHGLAGTVVSNVIFGWTSETFHGVTAGLGRGKMPAPHLASDEDPYRGGDARYPRAAEV